MKNFQTNSSRLNRRGNEKMACMKHRNWTQYLEPLLQQRLQRNAWYCLGLGNNVDQEIVWDSAIIDRLFTEYPINGDSQTQNFSEGIATPPQFLCLLLNLFRQGKGGEYPLANEQICRFLESHFDCQATLGGTGARGGRTLAHLGFLVLLHLNILSQTVQDLLASPLIHTTIPGGITRVRDLGECGRGEYAPHFIVQYNRGDTIHAARQRIECPQANRIILPFDEINKTLPLYDHFFRAMLETSDRIASVVISGFNAMTDEALLLQRLTRLKTALLLIHSKHIPIYFEDGGYHVPRYKEHVFRALGPLIDVCGMNEDEFFDILHLHHHTVNMSDLHSIVAGLEAILTTYDFKSVVLHTKDYALFYGARFNESIEAGLEFANLLAATRARIGKDGNLRDVEDTYCLPDSEQGITFQQQSQNSVMNRYLVVSPAKYLSNPACTIGLGDTFVAGFQICF